MCEPEFRVHHLKTGLAKPGQIWSAKSKYSSEERFRHHQQAPPKVLEERVCQPHDWPATWLARPARRCKSFLLMARGQCFCPFGHVDAISFQEPARQLATGKVPTKIVCFFVDWTKVALVKVNTVDRSRQRKRPLVQLQHVRFTWMFNRRLHQPRHTKLRCSLRTPCCKRRTRGFTLDCLQFVLCEMLPPILILACDASKRSRAKASERRARWWHEDRLKGLFIDHMQHLTGNQIIHQIVLRPIEDVEVRDIDSNLVMSTQSNQPILDRVRATKTSEENQHAHACVCLPSIHKLPPRLRWGPGKLPYNFRAHLLDDAIYWRWQGNISVTRWTFDWERGQHVSLKSSIKTSPMAILMRLEVAQQPATRKQMNFVCPSIHSEQLQHGRACLRPWNLEWIAPFRPEQAQLFTTTPCLWERSCSLVSLLLVGTRTSAELMCQPLDSL